MTRDYLHDYETVAAEMNALPTKPDATMDYDILSDAITWSDEHPAHISGQRSQFDCIRILFRFRMSLILGEPDDTLRHYWDRARELFPNWPGFIEQRLIPTTDIVHEFHTARKRAMRFVDKFIKYDAPAHDKQ